MRWSLLFILTRETSVPAGLKLEVDYGAWACFTILGRITEIGSVLRCEGWDKFASGNTRVIDDCRGSWVGLQLFGEIVVV